jgi:RNA polymerase sigma-70 factor (ECF subfamily)
MPLDGQIPGPAPQPLTQHATVVLRRLVEGDSNAAEELLPLVYEHLRALAGNYFRGQPGDHTLQPTALVHEAYLKLINQTGAAWNDRAHFLAVAATAMRQVLKDSARRRNAVKRGGGEAGGDRERVNLTDVQTPSGESIVDAVALDTALSRLAELNPRQARIVELRFFGGLTNEEVGRVLELSTRMIEKEWRRTRAWLSVELGGGIGDEEDASS